MGSWYNPDGGFPILSLITYLPLVGVLAVLLIPRRNEGLVKLVANGVLLIDFLLSLPLYFSFHKESAAYQWVESWPWFSTAGGKLVVGYHFGLDGISLMLVLLTTLLGFVATYSSWNAIHERLKEYYVFMLLLQVGMLGVFCSLDFVLFYVFWEVMLVPMYFLIGVWGGPRKLYAAIKFFLYTLAGSVLMLLGIIKVFFHHAEMHATEALAGIASHSAYTFDVPILTQFLQAHPLELNRGVWWGGVQGLVFLAFFVGFAIKVPMFPFHTWLPDAHVEAPTAGSVILAGVLLKMGTYGFIRFSLPMFPEATKFFLPFLVTLCLIGIVYGALVAMKQSDMKKLIAYSSVSHLGFCMLGLFALNQNGLLGGMLQMINHGLSTGALFLIVGVVYERRHNREIAEYGGLSKVMPIYAVVFLIATMSSIGLPVLNGFIGEFTILVGIFSANHPMAHTWTAIAATGIVLGAAYMLWLYQRVMFGKLDNPKNQGLKDLSLHEIAVFAPLIILCFWIGLQPTPFIAPMEKSIERVVQAIDPKALEGASIRPKIEEAHAKYETARLQPHGEHGAGHGEDHGGAPAEHQE